MSEDQKRTLQTLQTIRTVLNQTSIAGTDARALVDAQDLIQSLISQIPEEVHDAMGNK